MSTSSKISSSHYGIEPKTIDVETELVSYMIDDLNDEANTTVNATSDGIQSEREEIIYIGKTDHMNEEPKKIKEEEAAPKKKQDLKNK